MSLFTRPNSEKLKFEKTDATRGGSNKHPQESPPDTPRWGVLISRLEGLSFVFGLLCQRDIKKHHDYEARDDTEGCWRFVAVAMGFRDDFMTDNEQHGPGGNGQRHGQQDRRQRNDDRADEAARRFNNAGAERHADSAQGCVLQSHHRQCNGKAFWQILQENSGGQG